MRCVQLLVSYMSCRFLTPVGLAFSYTCIFKQNSPQVLGHHKDQRCYPREESQCVFSTVTQSTGQIQTRLTQRGTYTWQISRLYLHALSNCNAHITCTHTCHSTHIYMSRKQFLSEEERAKCPQLAHIPFGWDPRSCIGMRLALMEVKLTFIEILHHYTLLTSPDIEVQRNILCCVTIGMFLLVLPMPLQVPPQICYGMSDSPKNGILLKVMPRA